MDWISTIGFLAAAGTTASFLPQVIKSWKTSHTKDISLAAFSLLVSGVFLWLVYGLLTKDLPLIIANGITFVLASSILVMKIKNG